MLNAGKPSDYPSLIKGSKSLDSSSSTSIGDQGKAFDRNSAPLGGLQSQVKGEPDGEEDAMEDESTDFSIPSTYPCVSANRFLYGIVRGRGVRTTTSSLDL